METHRLALPAGYRIENYEIQAVLGKGGFGITYVAYDWTLGRHMAVKELLPDSIATRIEGSTVVAMSPSHAESWQWARERFVEEAQILAGFRHPNIIAVHRLIEGNGTVYLVMDHLEGESYEARLRRIGREPDEVSLMAVMGPLLDGLQEVHAAGLLHRDIKPENILFDKRGNPVLIDFGAARATVGATMTMTSIVTHGYSPIEQYQTKGKMGPWTDIYALGAVMCRAITGEKPPVASDRLMEDDFPWLSYRPVGGFSPKFLQAVDWSLRVRPEERPKAIAEWEGALRGAGASPTAAEAGETPALRSRSEAPQVELPRVRKSQPPQKRKFQPLVVAGVVGVVLLGIVLATAMRIQSREAEKRVEAARLAENQRANEELRAVQEAAEVARQEKADADKKAEEQARLAREAEAARKAAEEQARIAREAEAERKTAEEQARLAREAEAARKAADEQARLAREAKAAQADASKKATKESPFENSLGMTFVPVPGTGGLFSVWDTRVKDFRAYAEASGYRQQGGVYVPDGEKKLRLEWDTSWDKPRFSQTESHPVVGVSWNEAKAFCKWLTTMEQAEGIIAKDQEYRLPADAEWSVAVGSGKYPWGYAWPPPKGAGNYTPSLGVDTYIYTSPVGSFAANRFGLYDMGGNIWQWCEDWYRAGMSDAALLEKYTFLKNDGGGLKYRVIRGGSWKDGDIETSASSTRLFSAPSRRVLICGFRCVLAPLQ